MTPKPPPSRLGPPPQLLTKLEVTRKLQPKLMEVAIKHIKFLAKWLDTQQGCKQVLLSWMVVLVAIKMVILALTYTYFTLTSLVSLQTFHAVWILTFMMLSLHPTKTSLPTGSCLLSAYLPTATLLHILLIPRDFPMKYIITDALTSLVAIFTMFILLRMECGLILEHTQGILHQNKAPASKDGEPDTELPTESQSPQAPRQTRISMPETVSSPQYQQHPSMDGREGTTAHTGYPESLDLEPIDFEHFLEEPESERNQQVENMFRVTFVETPARGR